MSALVNSNKRRSCSVACQAAALKPCKSEAAGRKFEDGGSAASRGSAFRGGGRGQGWCLSLWPGAHKLAKARR